MTGWEYLGALAVSFACMVAVDYRWRVFWWADRRRAVIVMAVGIALFLVWDAAGILTGSFERGESSGMTGIELTPDFPLEELVFITFLCHLTMVLVMLAGRLLDAVHPADSEDAP
ncbi:lycopene cyclase domain-containing protein [Sanguibacter gelidistatuariae]|uniref:Lycopene cyclase domain-containing protein n=1 Tax=Sanguibacter gelidistatuariae TaxID=1814289 RepID=A0A1G6RUD2_9MICO|nr:lycopene cyclase domain-containing protein [Sanguibacter gelidistatuariae]SDD08051.1 lycopene cyclase domain-containing protein [Sanguibacter gelidistatuariae]